MDELILLVRVLINDNDPSDQTYTDTQLEQIVVSAARLLIMQIDFDNDYTLSIDNGTITPDPANDSGFIGLASLRAACIILASELKVAANQSYIVKDGPSTIDMRSHYESVADVYARFLDDFDKARIAYQAGNSRAGKAILSTYVSGNVEGIWGNFS